MGADLLDSLQKLKLFRVLRTLVVDGLGLRKFVGCGKLWFFLGMFLEFPERLSGIFDFFWVGS